MKYLRLFLFVTACASFTHAQDDERRAPPVEIPDFTNLDEFIYEPKSTVSLGVRLLSGAKTSFSGTGQILNRDDPGPATGDDILRTYRDGAVGPDTRTAPISGTGNPVRDPTGGGSGEPVAESKFTNNWTYTDPDQLTERPGFVTFHSYSATIVDTTTREQESKSIPGLELVGAHDMGKLFGSRMTWSLAAGMSVNDIQSDATGGVRATVRRLSDSFFLPDQTPPPPPYTSPSTGADPLPNGGSSPSKTEVLISDYPWVREITEVTDTTSVTNRWKVKGSYFTFRVGPTVWIPITARFKASVSIGAALAYVGTNYGVTQSFEPDDGGEVITELVTSDEDKLLPGYYVDASLQFDLTERAGFYAGAVYQSTGSYTQRIESPNANYSTKIDLEGQSGLRAGMTIRF